MATINYNFPLDPNGHSESELITALYLYGDKVKIEQMIAKKASLFSSTKNS